MKKWLILWLMLGSSLAWGQMSRVRPPVKLNCSSNMPTVGRTIGELCSNSGTGELMYWNGVAWVVIGASAGGADVGIAFPHLYCDGSGTTDDPWTSTDCTAGIELAIEALGSNGGIVQLVPGYYQSCDVINIKSNITLQGFGIDKSIIRRQALTISNDTVYPQAFGIKFGPSHLGWWDWRTLGQTGENIVLQDFTFDQNGQNQNLIQTYDYDLNNDGTFDRPFNYPIGVGMLNKLDAVPSNDRLGGLDGLRISRIKVINTLENNLDVRSAKNVIIEDSEFYDCGVNLNYDSPQCNGINIGCVDDYDTDNDNTYDGVDQTHAAGWCNNTIIRNNKISRMDNLLPNSAGECIATQNQSNILIQGNDLSVCDAGVEQGGDTITMKNIRIIDNSVHDLNTRRAFLTPYDSDWDGTIEAGEYSSLGVYGFGFVGVRGNKAINMTLTGNNIITSDEGFHIYNVEGLIISNNNIYGTGKELADPKIWEGHKAGIEVIPRTWESVLGTGGAGGCIISNNTIQMGGGGNVGRGPYPYGIILQYATDCEVIGNTISGFTNESLGDTGISIGASSNRIQVIGNTISGTYGVAYNIVGESPFDLNHDGTIAPGEVMDGAEDVIVRQNNAIGYSYIANNNGINSHVEDLNLDAAYTTGSWMNWDFGYDGTVDYVFGTYGIYGQGTNPFGVYNKGNIRFIADYDNDATGDDTDPQHNIYYDTDGDGTYEWYMTDTKLDFLKNSTVRVAATLGGSSSRLNLLSAAGMTISADADASGNETLTIEGNVDANKRITFGTCNVTAASTTTIDDCNHTSIDGTTTVTNINTCDTANNGRILVIRCSSDATPFTDGGNLKLAGNFTCSADDSISLICDGTNWVEIARSVN